MKNLLQKSIISLFIVSIYPVIVCSQNEIANKEVFIDNLLQQMTTQEKIGQLNLLVGGDINTGVA